MSHLRISPVVLAHAPKAVEQQAIHTKRPPTVACMTRAWRLPSPLSSLLQPPTKFDRDVCQQDKAQLQHMVGALREEVATLTAERSAQSLLAPTIAPSEYFLAFAQQSSGFDQLSSLDVLDSRYLEESHDSSLSYSYVIEMTSCPETCFGSSCEELSSHTCDALESLGCDCSGCDCCRAVCFGYSCNYWSSNYACNFLESTYGCDCSGCDCPTPTPTMTPTTMEPTVSLAPTFSELDVSDYDELSDAIAGAVNNDRQRVINLVADIEIQSTLYIPAGTSLKVVGARATNGTSPGHKTQRSRVSPAGTTSYARFLYDVSTRDEIVSGFARTVSFKLARSFSINVGAGLWLYHARTREPRDPWVHEYGTVHRPKLLGHGSELPLRA